MTTPPTSRSTTPGILSETPRRDPSSSRELPRQTRFVTESHALDGQVASPRAIFIAATIALAVYLIGRRLSSD